MQLRTREQELEHAQAALLELQEAKGQAGEGSRGLFLGKIFLHPQFRV